MHHALSVLIVFFFFFDLSNAWYSFRASTYCQNIFSFVYIGEVSTVLIFDNRSTLYKTNRLISRALSNIPNQNC